MSWTIIGIFLSDGSVRTYNKAAAAILNPAEITNMI